MPRMRTPFLSSSLSAVRRGWSPCATPNAQFSCVCLHPGVLLDRCGHRVERCPGTLSRRSHVEAVEVGEHKVVGVEVARALGEPVVLAPSEKGRRQRIPWLPAFPLGNAVGGTAVVGPEVLRGLPVEEPHEGEQSLQLWRGVELAEHCSPLDVVVGADAVEGQDDRVGVLVGGCAECESEGVRSGPRAQCELVRRCRVLDRVRELGG